MFLLAFATSVISSIEKLTNDQIYAVQKNLEIATTSSYVSFSSNKLSPGIKFWEEKTNRLFTNNSWIFESDLKISENDFWPEQKLIQENFEADCPISCEQDMRFLFAYKLPENKITTFKVDVFNIYIDDDGIAKGYNYKENNLADTKMHATFKCNEGGKDVFILIKGNNTSSDSKKQIGRILHITHQENTPWGLKETRTMFCLEQEKVSISRGINYGDRINADMKKYKAKVPGDVGWFMMKENPTEEETEEIEFDK